MNATDFMGWWNWIFVAPFLLGALMVALSVFGISGDDGDSDGGDVGVDMDGDGDADGDGDDGLLSDVLETLHLHGVPPLMVLQNALLWWGICGWSANRMLGQNGAAMIVISLPVALFGGLILTATTSRFLARLAPEGGSSAARANELEGRSGEATATITAKGGEAFVRDASGTLHQIAVRVGDDDEAIRRGQSILVLNYDAVGGCYRVRLWSEV